MVARTQVTATPPAVSNRKSFTKRPYATVVVEKIDIATQYLAKTLAHLGHQTQDKTILALAAEAEKVAAKWQAPVRNNQALANVKSPSKGRQVGPVLPKGDKVQLLGSEYERASILHGAKVAGGLAVVEELVKGSSWVKVRLPGVPQPIAATSRMLTRDASKAAQAHADIEKQLAAADPV